MKRTNTFDSSDSIYDLLFPFISATQITPVRVNSTVTLRCSLSNLDYINRFWYKGHHSAVGTLSSPYMTLFTQIGQGGITILNARSDMSVDPMTFAMTIGTAQLEDDGYFTCRVLDSPTLQDVFNQTLIGVYSKLLLFYLIIQCILTAPFIHV